MIIPANEIESFKTLMKMLSVQFGPKSEFVLHDLTKSYESTIIAIENNSITGREVGDCGSNMGLEILRSGRTADESDEYGYITVLKDGRILRSSSMYFHDENGKLVGALCINTDITAFQHMNDYMSSLLPTDKDTPKETEVFARNITELLDFHLQKCNELLDYKTSKEMTKEDKLNAVRYLDSKGVFLITKSGSKICKYLGISKGTLYSYLETVRESDPME